MRSGQSGDADTPAENVHTDGAGRGRPDTRHRIVEELLDSLDDIVLRHHIICQDPEKQANPEMLAAEVARALSRSRTRIARHPLPRPQHP